MAAGCGRVVCFSGLAGGFVLGLTLGLRRPSSTVRANTDGLTPPSLDLVVEVTRFERELQVQQLDAMDSKAGTLLGFAGLLVALIATVGSGWFLVPGAVAAGGAAVAAMRATRSTKLHRIAPEKAYAWWANLPRDQALWQAYADEIQVLRLDDGVVKAKLRRVKAAWGMLAFAIVLAALGIVAEVILNEVT
jgi:hypothetical protein